jgi:hypothetical protein
MARSASPRLLRELRRCLPSAPRHRVNGRDGGGAITRTAVLITSRLCSVTSTQGTAAPLRLRWLEQLDRVSVRVL